MHAAEDQISRGVARFKWPALLLAIYICCFWKLALSDQYTWLDAPDYAYQVLPWYQFQAGEWHRGHFPLWDPYLWGGQPLVGQAQPGAVYPLNWLLFLAPLRNGWIRQSYLHWYFVLIHFQGALFCYWLCRDLRRSPPAALLAAVAFGLGGFVGTNNWPAMLNGAVWAPVILLFFLRAMRGERPVSSAALSGAALGIAFLSGHHQIPIYIALAMAGAWIYYLLQDRKRLRLLLIFGLFLALTSAVQTLPAYEYGRLSLRWVGAENAVGWRDRVPYSVHQQFGFYPESILGTFIPGLFRNSDPFVGLVALTMGLFGIAGAWRDRTARLFGAIALGGLLFSLGHNSVFHGVLYAVVPMVEKARSPSMASFIFHFGLCVLIAYGIDGSEVIKTAFSKWTARGLAALSAVVATVFWGFLATKTAIDDRIGMVALCGLLLAAILIAWRKDSLSPGAARALLGVVMLLELGNVTTYSYPRSGNPNSPLKKLTEHYDIAGFLQDQSASGPVRVEIESNDLPYNFGDWYGIEHFGGYLASLTENVNGVQGTAKARRMFAVNYLIASKPYAPDQVEVFSGRSGLKVYRNPGAYPRTWIVHEAVSITGNDQVGRLLDSAAFDPRRQTFLKGQAPNLEKCAQPETATLRTHLSNRIVIEANLSCRGMVIDSDTFFPGWEASVDGKPAAVYEAYGFLRGVVAEAGRHRIELRYRPKSVYQGAVLTALGLLGTCLLAALKW
ncbi:MAG TPA: hypothetical protein VL285_03010 [Bryobacteraceae bacterium]|nr:hypothetical protein [Bryobacteraceae bacterium]